MLLGRRRGASGAVLQRESAAKKLQRQAELALTRRTRAPYYEPQRLEILQGRKMRKGPRTLCVCICVRDPGPVALPLPLSLSIYIHAYIHAYMN